MAAVIAGDVNPAEKGFARLRPGAVQTSTSSEEAIRQAHAKLYETFQTGRTKTYEWRVAQLEGMRKLVQENTERICEAISKDLGRPRMEAVLGEVAPVVAEVDHSLKHLKAWMAPEAVGTPITQKPGHSAIRREPKGVILNIAPWNFPINLALNAVVGIVGAGNCCLLKPSEISAASEEVLKTLLPRYLDPEAVIVITGGVPESTALLKLRWDHIFYTGNGAVARVVARAAAETLTPLTLELGGKSPTLVLPGANIKVSARRILSSKCFNAGQICIAPDYTLVHESVAEPLMQEMQQVLRSWYGNDASTSSSFGRIVNQNHFRRVRNLVDSADGEVLQQGAMDEASCFIPPTLIKEPSSNSPVMEEEIFGPVMPILRKKSVAEMISHVNAGEKPLAMYIFGPEADCNKVIEATSSGGVCVNDTIFHIANPELPFGGVGASGMGRYHGKSGFDEFSHIRSVMYRATWLDPPQRYPPFNDDNLKVLQRLLIGPILTPGAKKALIAAGGTMVAGATLLLRSRL